MREDRAENVHPNNDRQLVEAGFSTRLGHLSVSRVATKALNDLGVELTLKELVTDNGVGQVTFSSGEALSIDMLISASGIIPNSTFVPKHLLNAEGYVQVDHFLQVKGARDVFAIGDVSDTEALQFWFVEK